MGVQHGQSLGTLSKQQGATGSPSETQATLKLNGSKQEVAAMCTKPRDSIKRCVCKKKVNKNGETYLEVVGTVREEIRLLSGKT